MSNDKRQKNVEFRITNAEQRAFCFRHWVFVILSTFVIGNSSLGGPLDSVNDQNLRPTATTIDLASALRLAGVQNPEILLARERVTEAAAVRQLAAAQILPSLNAGLNFDVHTGPLQQASGNILKVNRDALYLGAGSYAVAAGT